MPTLKQLRNKIDKIDTDIIKKVSQRNELSVKIWKLKSKLKHKVFDSKREQKLMLLHEKICRHYNLKTTFIKKLFRIIMVNSRELQK